MEHLTHGWEPETPARDSLVRGFVEASASRGDFIALAAGGRAERIGPLALADANSPVWFENAAVLMTPPELTTRDEVVAAFDGFYPRDRHAVLVSAFPIWDLTSDGFELMGHPPFMLRPVGGEAPSTPSGFTIRPVLTERDVAEFAATIAEAYPLPGAESAALMTVRELEGKLRLFTGYLDGVPVGTAGTWIDHGVNQVEWISAHPDTRGKGVGAALTWAATVADPTLPGVLIASDFGQPVYERLGYLRVMRMTMWQRPPRP